MLLKLEKEPILQSSMDRLKVLKHCALCGAEFVLQSSMDRLKAKSLSLNQSELCFYNPVWID